MCGIAGLLGRPSNEFAERVSQALAHRGPDDHGVWRRNDACLVHHRLSILDLSSIGHQPMTSSCGRWQLVFNGEIYNHNELRNLLQREGVTFKGNGDTEVLLAWMSRHGAEGLFRLRGMFSFCLYDTLKQEALLARDPHGIKPLYYWEGPKGELSFASELRALLASGLISKEPNPLAIAEFLATGSVGEPSTIVKGVRRLPAGHRLQWNKERLICEPWLPLPESLNDTSCESISPSSAAIRTRGALECSVRAHMTSDVPVGLFLSSGLDSAAILALAPGNLHTFTIGFPDVHASCFDESKPAAAIAKYFGVENTMLMMDSGQARNWLPSFLQNMDQPSIDGFNTWCVSRLASDAGLKVALSGLGGDELFGGYPSFREVPKIHRWRRKIGPLGPPLAALLRLPPSGKGHKIQRVAAMLKSAPSMGAAYRCFRGVFSPPEVDQLMTSWGFNPTNLDNNAVSHTYDLMSVDNETQHIGMLEGTHYLRNQLLPDSDVMSMASALELRLPFVDQKLSMDLAGVPPSLRLAPGKKLLKDAVPELPEWFLNRPKQGFRFPFQRWIEDTDTRLELSTPTVPKDIDMRPWYRRWSLMVLNHWLEAHLSHSLQRP